MGMNTRDQTSEFLTFQFCRSCLCPLGKEISHQLGERTYWVIHFPPTDEKINRLYPHPQLGLPFPFPLTYTSDGKLLQESRWRRTNTNTWSWKAGPCLRSGPGSERFCGTGTAQCFPPFCLPAYEGGLEKSSADLSPTLTPAWTRVATNTKSPNKWLYMMWSLSDALRGRVNAT